jgi:hypothetical protein
LWEAQLGKSLERHQRACAPVVRKKLEDEYRELSDKLGAVYRAEYAAKFAEMTDEEFERWAEEEGALNLDDWEDPEALITAMSLGELKEGIEWQKAELAKYAARPREHYRPLPSKTLPSRICLSRR